MRLVILVLLTTAACSGAPAPAPKAAPPAAVAVSQPGLVSVTGKAPQGAVVALEPPAGAERVPPTGSVLMNQVGQQFTPEVLLARVGQPVEFRNGEGIPHNVQVARSGGATSEINVSTDPSQSYTHTFARAGAYDVSCDIHPSMRASIIVVDTPYAATADDFGQFLIMNVPPGTYRLMTIVGAKTTERQVQLEGPHTDVGS